MKALGIIFSNIHNETIDELTRKRTSASIPFGGRYRLIDFALSNLVNAGVDNVGILAQKNYQSLMDHLGSWKVWVLSRRNGGLVIFPPFGNYKIDTLYTSRLEALISIKGFIENQKDRLKKAIEVFKNLCYSKLSEVSDKEKMEDLKYLIESISVSSENPLTVRYYLANSAEYKQFRIKME